VNILSALNAMKEQFDTVTVLGKPMLFTCLRIDRSTVPKGMYIYEVRHADEDWGEPCQIANWVLVNHYGTLICNVPLPVQPNHNSNNAYLAIDAEADWDFEGSLSTLKKYMEQHPPHKEKQKEREL
jgi:hypothetical protein